MTSDIGRRGPRRLRSPLASRKESSTLSERGRPGVITLLTRSLLKTTARGEWTPDLARAHSARSEKIEFFPREFPAAASITAPGCRMCFLRRPGETVASVVHPPQTLSLVPTEVHGFSASH